MSGQSIACWVICWQVWRAIVHGIWACFLLTFSTLWKCVWTHFSSFLFSSHHSCFFNSKRNPFVSVCWRKSQNKTEEAGWESEKISSPRFFELTTTPSGLNLHPSHSGSSESSVLKSKNFFPSNRRSSSWLNFKILNELGSMWRDVNIETDGK